MSRSRSLTALAGAAALGLLAACSGGSDAAGDTAGGPDDDPVVVAVPESVLESVLPGESQNSHIDGALFSSLTQLDTTTGEVENLVAESIESEDQQHWTIKVAEGWTFHDGSPVTAQSFADSWNVTADPTNALNGNPRAAIFEGYEEMNPAEGEPTADSLSGVEVIDESTLEVTLTEPNSLFPYALSASVYGPIPEGAADDIEAFATHPVGNGPFQAAGGGWDIGDQDVFLERYEDYAGTPAEVAEINLRVYQASANPYTDVEAGQLDLALVADDDLVRAKQDLPEQVVDVTLPAIVYLAFPLYDERFEDERVRQALSLAIDRETIVDSLMSGTAEPATGLGPDVLIGADQVECATCRFDPDEAQRLLEEAGGWSGPLRLMTYQEPGNERALEAVANQLRENLGIEQVEFESQPIGQLYDGLRADQAQGPTLLYSGVAYPHVYAMGNQVLTTGASLNMTRYDDEEFGDLMSRSAASGDPDEATSLAAQAATHALDSAPLTPLYYPKAGLVHSERVTAVVPEFLGGPRLASISVG